MSEAIPQLKSEKLAWRPDMRALSPFLALAALIVLGTVLNPDFLSVSNLTNVVTRSAFIAIIAVGATFVIASGGLDLSVGSMAAFVAGAMIMILNDMGGADGGTLALGMLAALVLGAACGLANGVIVTVGRIEPFIVTLGTMGIFRALIVYLAAGGTLTLSNFQLREMYRPFYFGSVLGIPVPVVAFVVVAAIASVILYKTPFGRHVVAIGSNREVARYSGVPIWRVVTLTYVIQGLCVGLAVLVYVPRLGSATPTTGLLWELQAITAVVIGGTALRGGTGRIWGTIVGAVILEVVGNIMVLSNLVSEYLIGAVQGAIIIIAMLVQRSLQREGMPVLGGRRKRKGSALSREEKVKPTKMRIAAAAALLIGLTGAATAQQKNVTIGVSIPAATHGWTAGVIYHAERTKALLEKAYPGLKVVVKTSPNGAAQANALDDLSQQKIDALVVLPFNSDELTGPVAEVKKRGTFVTVVDRGLKDPSIQDVYVAGNNPEFGRVSGQYFKDNLKTGDIVVLRGIPTVIDSERVDNFEKAIAGSGVKIIDKQFANWSRDDAFKVMQDFLAKHKKIDAVWAADDDMAIGVLEAIKQANRTDIKMVIGGAGMKDMVKRVIDGDKMVPINVLYPPAMIATAIQVTVAHYYGGAPVRGTYLISSPLITQANAKEYYFPDSPF